MFRIPPETNDISTVTFANTHRLYKLPLLKEEVVPQNETVLVDGFTCVGPVIVNTSGEAHDRQTESATPFAGIQVSGCTGSDQWDRTLEELSSRFELQASPIQQWKQQLLAEGAVMVMWWR